MLVSDLKKRIVKDAKITRQAVEARVKKLSIDYGPISDEIAYGIVAHQLSLNVAKLIKDEEILGQIREQLDRIAILENDGPPKKPKTVVKTVTVNIGKKLSLSDPIVSRQVIGDAEEMTVFYASLYVFENSVREFINKILTKELGATWWDDTVKTELKDKVKNRIDKENNNAWHGRRGSHPIYYTDMSDLTYLLIHKNWDYFKKFFPDQHWIITRLNEISMSRNIVDHHNPLRKRDQDRLAVYFRDWQDQISNFRNEII